MRGITLNITTFPSLYFGFDNEEDVIDGGMNNEKWKQFKKRQNKEEQQLFNQIIREKSNIPPEKLKELQRWEKLFHEEVHGSKFSFVDEGQDWVRGKKLLSSIYPVPKIKSIRMYINTVIDVAWLFLRLFPYLQPEKNAFGQPWKEKHAILDDSFHLCEQDLSNDGNQIAKAFIYFVKDKFSFDDDFHYFEANRTGKQNNTD